MNCEPVPDFGESDSNVISTTYGGGSATMVI